MEEAQGRIGDTLANDTALDPENSDTGDEGNAPSPQIAPSLLDEAATLIDNARTYAEAELGFQKTRAAFAGRLVGVALGLGVVALILLHIAFLALAVGLVLAFEPVTGIWGAIGIVFGGLLVVVGLLGWAAFCRISKLAALFASPDEDSEA